MVEVRLHVLWYDRMLQKLAVIVGKIAYTIEPPLMRYLKELVVGEVKVQNLSPQ